MKQNLIIAVLTVIVSALALNTFFGWFMKTPEEKLLNEVLNPKTDTIEIEKIITKDSLIFYSYEPNVGILPSNNVTKNYNTYITDTLAPALKIAINKIAELQQVKATLEGTVKSQKTEIDNERNQKVYYKDRYFSAVSKTDTTGNSTLDYKYAAQIDVVTEQAKKNKLNVYLHSPDPNLTINGVEHFKKEVYIKPKKWGIGFQGGYYYVPSENKFVPAIGAGISYNFIRF